MSSIPPTSPKPHTVEDYTGRKEPPTAKIPQELFKQIISEPQNVGSKDKSLRRVKNY